MVAPVVAAPATSSVGSIVAGIGGSIVSGLFGRSSAKRSIAFQREIAKNAHQWEVEDLRAAGLNPILSGTGGPGARASGGAMPPTPDFASSAMQSLRLQKELANIQAQTDKTNMETEGIKSQNVVRALDAYIAGGKLTVLKAALKRLGLTAEEIDKAITGAGRGKRGDIKLWPFKGGYSDQSGTPGQFKAADQFGPSA